MAGIKPKGEPNVPASFHQLVKSVKSIVEEKFYEMDCLGGNKHGK